MQPVAYFFVFNCKKLHEFVAFCLNIPIFASIGNKYTVYES